MPMLLLMLLMAEGETDRALISALISLSVESNASLCRKAAIQPASLVRFLEPGTVGQLSSAKQLDLLAVLFWPHGVPKAKMVHIWRVTDDVSAPHWLLQTKMKANVQLAAVKPVGGEEMKSDVLVGFLGPQTPLIITTRVAGSLDVLLADSVSAPLQGKANKRVRKLALDPELIEELRAGVTSVERFQAVLVGKEERGPQADTIAMVNQFSDLGLDFAEHQRLLLDWLVERANTDPASLAKDLTKISSLDLPGLGRSSPTGMTPAKIDALVKKIACLPANTAEAVDSARLPGGTMLSSPKDKASPGKKMFTVVATHKLPREK